jgi:hypothetical protein
MSERSPNSRSTLLVLAVGTCVNKELFKVLQQVAEVAASLNEPA